MQAHIGIGESSIYVGDHLGFFTYNKYSTVRKLRTYCWRLNAATKMFVFSKSKKKRIIELSSTFACQFMCFPCVRYTHESRLTKNRLLFFIAVCLLIKKRRVRNFKLCHYLFPSWKWLQLFTCLLFGNMLLSHRSYAVWRTKINSHNLIDNNGSSQSERKKKRNLHFLIKLIINLHWTPFVLF